MMNNQDRRRIAKLVSEAYQTRRALVHAAPSSLEATTISQSILTRHKLKDKVAKINKVRNDLAALERSLSESLAALRKGYGPAKTYRHGCECYEKWEDVLRDLVAEVSREAKEARDKSISELLAEERQMLARVEVATTLEEMKELMRLAQLLK